MPTRFACVLTLVLAAAAPAQQPVTVVPIPPLVVGTRTGAPTLDNPNAVLLVGGKALATGTDGGARFVYGSGIGEAKIGYEAVYTFLGGNTGRYNSTDPTSRGYVVGLPFFN